MAEEAEKAEESPQTKGRMWLFVGLGVALLLAIAGWGLYMTSGAGQAEASDAVEAEVVDEPEPEVTEVLELDPFVVHLEGTRAAAYARVGLSFGFQNNDPGTPVVDPNLLLPKIKDYLLMHLSGQSVEDLSGGENKLRIKEEIKQAVSEMIPPDRGKLVEVYLTELLVQ
ncbi:MAG: flagellar basal body-associated protein FliL [Acidobacteriota bacterium]